jgi:hypothetical protein
MGHASEGRGNKKHTQKFGVETPFEGATLETKEMRK